MNIQLFLPSLGETETYGRLLGEHSRPGDVLLLTGDLGAGKTTLTRFIALGLDITNEYIISPSFSLMNQYFGRIPLYHIDCYRLHDEDDVEASGILDYIVADGLTVIEWPDRLGNLTPVDRLEIDLLSGREEERYVTMTAHGKGWQKRLTELRDSFPGSAEGEHE